MPQAKYSVTDSATKIITAYTGRDEFILRAGSGSDVVWLGNTADVNDSEGIYLDAGDTLVINGPMAKQSWWAVCASGESGTIHAVLEA